MENFKTYCIGLVLHFIMGVFFSLIFASFVCGACLLASMVFDFPVPVKWICGAIFGMFLLFGDSTFTVKNKKYKFSIFRGFYI